ncbi:MAG: hypothetical protein ACD_37C00442G0002 [uncultured bacterium]|nr:MAG: hypothetical protein ACD_37C00442G0002 [uncultured bacterium]
MNFIPDITIGEILNIIILAATAYIVWLYTKAAQKTNEIQEQPALNLSLHEEDNGVNKKYILKVKNIGRAPAYNIMFLGLKTKNFIYHPYFRKGEHAILEAGSEQILHFWVKKLPNAVEAYDHILGFQLFLQRFFPNNIEPEKYEEHKRASAIFVLNYGGLSGKRYHSIFRIYSKIWPLLQVYDLVTEFVRIGEGYCKEEEAKQLCLDRETIPKFLE